MIVSHVFIIAGASAFGGFIYFLAIIFLSRRSPSHADVSENKIENAPKQKVQGPILSWMVNTLAENPKSKKSVVIRIYAAAAVLGLTFLLTLKVIFGALLGVGVYFIIGWYFNSRIKKKMMLFDNQLVEALGIVTNSVRVGQSLMQALEGMVKETKDPISGEFEAALRKVKLGVPLNQALDEINLRVNSKDLKIVVTSINLARDAGGNLAEILSRIADTMRERKKIQGKIGALTAQGRMSGMVMGAVPFLLLLVLYFIEPEMMGLLFTTVLGNLMLTVAIVMISIGMFVISKIVNIDI